MCFFFHLLFYYAIILLTSNFKSTAYEDWLKNWEFRRGWIFFFLCGFRDSTRTRGWKLQLNMSQTSHLNYWNRSWVTISGGPMEGFLFWGVGLSDIRSFLFSHIIPAVFRLWVKCYMYHPCDSIQDFTLTLNIVK